MTPVDIAAAASSTSLAMVSAVLRIVWKMALRWGRIEEKVDDLKTTAVGLEGRVERLEALVMIAPRPEK